MCFFCLRTRLALQDFLERLVTIIIIIIMDSEGLLLNTSRDILQRIKILRKKFLANQTTWAGWRYSFEVLPMVDSMVNMTSRALRSDADDGMYRERDRRELCGVAQTTGGIANVIIASSAEWRILSLATLRTRPLIVKWLVHRSDDGNSGQIGLLNWLTAAHLG